MALSKDKKKVILGDIENSLKDAKSVIFVDFKGLKVNDANKLRRKLEKENIGYTVAKKTLIDRVLDSKGYTGTKPAVLGQMAIVYSTDLLAPAREMYEFQKKNKDSMAILGGVFDGRYIAKEEAISIASIPPLQTLRAQFVNLINSPIQGLAMVLDGIAKKKA